MLHAREDYNRIQDPEGKIPFDEPVFLIRAQDVVGAEVVRYWARKAYAAGASDDIVKRAYDHANKMDVWSKKKTPDVPSSL